MSNIEDIEAIKNALVGNLIAIEEYNTGDEIRYIAICRHLTIDDISKIKNLKLKPMLFTEEEIKDSSDVFPIEFLSMKKRHKLLWGEDGKDILKDINISKKDLRQQLEFEFRSKLLHLRQAYLASNDKMLDNIILAAVPNLSPIIGALMYLKDLPFEGDEDIFLSTYGIDTSILREIYHIRKGKVRFRKDKIEYIGKLITVLEEIGDMLDTIQE